MSRNEHDLLREASQSHRLQQDRQDLRISLRLVIGEDHYIFALFNCRDYLLCIFHSFDLGLVQDDQRPKKIVAPGAS
jgi:hypothetical protein